MTYSCCKTTRMFGLLGGLLISAATLLQAADPSCSVSVTNRLDLHRKGEIVELEWKQLQRRLSGVRPDDVSILADGVELPCQVVGTTEDGSQQKFLFQADYAPKQLRRFTIMAGRQKPSAAKPLAHALFVEHPSLDYIAWENDRIAFRLYGPLCEKRLVSSGVDVWAKRVARPVLDAMSKRDYHNDNGEGADCYTVGTGRGCGGLGIWKDEKLHVSRNFKSWKIVADGPLRTVIELNYAPWDVKDIHVEEVKRITLDAGSQLNRIESTLRFTSTDSLLAAIGLGAPKGATTAMQPDRRWASVWQATDGRDNGMLGIGLVTPASDRMQMREVAYHVLMLLPAHSGKPLVYYAGAGWTKFGFADAAAWNAYLDEFAQRLASPLEVDLPD